MKGFTLIEFMLGVAIVAIVVVALLGAFFGQAYLRTTARNLTAAMSDATRIMEQLRLQNSIDREPCKSKGIPTAVPLENGAPIAGITSWNAWLEDRTSGRGGGKSVNQGLSVYDINRLELVAVTCQDETGSYCSDKAEPSGCLFQACSKPPQVGSGEWKRQTSTATSFDPIRITIAVGWRQNQRLMGGAGSIQEFKYGMHISEPFIRLAQFWKPISDIIIPSVEAGGGGGGSPMRVSLDLKDGQDRSGNGVIDSPAMITTLITCR